MSFSMRDGGEGFKKNSVDSGGGKPRHFQYSSQKNKAGVWGTEAEESAADHFINHTRNTNKNSFIAGSNFSDNSRTYGRLNPSALDLDNVWSVRKNVRVSSDMKKGPTQAGKSFYSRHGTLGNSGQDASLISSNKRQKGLSPEEGSSWNSGRIGYSYSDSKLNTGGTDLFGDEFDSDISTGGLGKRKHSGISSKEDFNNVLNRRHGGGRDPGREQSARTKRAQRFQAAHQRSTGLGQFSQPTSTYFRMSDEGQTKWKKRDDWT